MQEGFEKCQEKRILLDKATIKVYISKLTKVTKTEHSLIGRTLFLKDSVVSYFSCVTNKEKSICFKTSTHSFR